MKNKITFQKTCGVYSSDLHFATMIFPFVANELEQGSSILTILEKDVEKNIEKILKNTGIKKETKNMISELDWKKTNILKIRKIFKELEQKVINKNITNIIIMGKRDFIQKINQSIDIWTKNNIIELKKYKKQINIVNCFSFWENDDIENIIEAHDFILKTTGLEEIQTEELLQAN